MKLYSYWRSSAAYRVRIALNLKNLPYEMAHVDLRAGAQRAAEYASVNPQGLVPALELDDGRRLTQSLAIMEFLEEMYPQPPLLPADPLARAYVRQLAQLVACDIHPINNLRVLNGLRDLFGIDEEGRNRWYRHFVDAGLAAMEALVVGSRRAGRFCCGEWPSLADACLVPQMYNARRYHCDLGLCPTLVAIDANCVAVPAFARARPEAQADSG
jgi:maleylacetoacetate isomerase